MPSKADRLNRELKVLHQFEKPILQVIELNPIELEQPYAAHLAETLLYNNFCDCEGYSRDFMEHFVTIDLEHELIPREELSSHKNVLPYNLLLKHTAVAWMLFVNKEWKIGWVYIITSKTMPGIVKVGYTRQTPEGRAKELRSTGNPGTYDVQFCELVSDPEGVELACHQQLTAYGWHVFSGSKSVSKSESEFGLLLDPESKLKPKPKLKSKGAGKSKGTGNEWFRCTVDEAIAVFEVVLKGRQKHPQFVVDTDSLRLSCCDPAIKLSMCEIAKAVCETFAFYEALEIAVNKFSDETCNRVTAINYLIDMAAKLAPSHAELKESKALRKEVDRQFRLKLAQTNRG